MKKIIIGIVTVLILISFFSYIKVKNSKDLVNNNTDNQEGKTIVSPLTSKENPINSLRYISTTNSGRPETQYAVDALRAYYAEQVIDADPQTLNVLKGSLEEWRGVREYVYARDKDSVFFEGKKLSGVFIETFRPLENGFFQHNYGTDEKSVYFGSEIIPGANPKTFAILWRTAWEGCHADYYSKDDKNVYLKTEKLIGVDADSFQAFESGYAKDKKGYYKGSEYIGTTIDPVYLTCSI